jgi:hypothetical protein
MMPLARVLHDHLMNCKLNWIYSAGVGSFMSSWKHLCSRGRSFSITDLNNCSLKSKVNSLGAHEKLTLILMRVRFLINFLDISKDNGHLIKQELFDFFAIGSLI